MTSSLPLIALPHRSVLQLSGAEAPTFLQGLITASTRHLAPNRAIYSAMLSPQGKMQAEFFVHDAGNDTLLIDVDSARAATLLGMLKIYKLRAKITLADVSSEWQSYALLGTTLDDARAQRPESAIISADPRTPLFASPALGLRVLLPASETAQASGDFGTYETLRIAAGVMQGAEDYTPERNFALELGLDIQGAIDFAKGCYVGQEVTNRSKHRGTLRKVLGRVDAVDASATLPASGTEILADGKVIGELRSSYGAHGLAQLRIEETQAAIAAGASITAGEIALHAQLPDAVLQAAHAAESN
jgi:folate-binding protein YgfZ